MRTRTLRAEHRRQPSSPLRRGARAAAGRCPFPRRDRDAGPPLLRQPRNPGFELAWKASGPVQGPMCNGRNRTCYQSITSRLLYRMSYICVCYGGTRTLVTQNLKSVALPLSYKHPRASRPWHTGLARPPAPGEHHDLRPQGSDPRDREVSDIANKLSRSIG